MLAQLNKSFSKNLFYRAKITRFEKTSFKVTVTVLFITKDKTSNFFQNFRLSPALSQFFSGVRLWELKHRGKV